MTVNHDLKLLRKMFNWGIRKGYLERTPFKIGTEPAITLEKEIPRARRFEHEDDEQKLLDAPTLTCGECWWHFWTPPAGWGRSCPSSGRT